MDHSYLPWSVTPANLCAIYMAAVPLAHILFRADMGVEQVHTLYHWWYTLSGTGNGNGARNGTTNRDQEILFPTVPVLYPVLSPGTCSVNKPWLVPKPTELTGLSLQIFKKETSKQESIPVGCIPPTLHHGGGLCLGGSPWQRPPASGQRPPGQRPPLEGTWNQRKRPL